MKNKLDYNIDWNETFQLNEESPSGLIRIKNGFGKIIQPIIAGTNCKNRGWVVRFQRKLYHVHRIIWVMTYGSIDPELVIDHLDGNPLNNNIQNLSLKTQKDNTRNSSKRSDNTSGITGVRLAFDGHSNYYYVARWHDLQGKMFSKHFPVKKLGYDLAKELAIAYRVQEINKLIIEGAGYTDRHGV